MTWSSYFPFDLLALLYPPKLIHLEDLSTLLRDCLQATPDLGIAV
jgi:hypothetical protein